MARTIGSAMVAAVIAVCVTSGASAKTCKAVLKERKIELSEAQARKAAIAAWSASAKQKHGAGFASWNNAGNKKMNCKLVTAAKRQQQLCVAIGRPCSN